MVVWYIGVVSSPALMSVAWLVMPSPWRWLGMAGDGWGWLEMAGLVGHYSYTVTGLGCVTAL